MIAGSNFASRSLAWSPSQVISPTNNINCRRTRSMYQPHRCTEGVHVWLLSSMADEDGVSSSKCISISEKNNRNRRDVLCQACIAATCISIAFVFSPKPAVADVTNKIASSTALRALKRAQDQLPTKLLPDAQANNFVGIKARLREAPFDEFRKNALILVRGGEDGPKASELLRAYKKLIASLEAIDATASLGMKGRKVDPFQLGLQYEDVAKALNSFLEVGAAAYAIPLQEAPSMQESLRYGSIDTKVLKSE